MEFPTDAKGGKSTQAACQDVFATAVHGVDPELAKRIRGEKQWRQKYCEHVYQVFTLGLQSPAKAVQIAQAGLAQAREQFVFTRDGASTACAKVADMAPSFQLSGAKVTGAAEPGAAACERHLGTLDLDDLVRAGTFEPDVAPAARSGLAAAQKGLRGKTFVVLGNAELGPVPFLLDAGATVYVVATRKPAKWKELAAKAKASAGTLVAPSRDGATLDGDCENIGADLLTELPEILQWLKASVSSQVCVGAYLYADGEANVRLTVAADCIIEALRAKVGKQGFALSYYMSCSMPLQVPDCAVAAHKPGWSGTLLRWEQGVRAVTADDGKTVHLCNGLSNMQGPNYCLAQTLRIWRALACHADGWAVSGTVAPVARTDSVCHVKQMKLALDGLARFPPLRAFQPEAVAALLFALLVQDLNEPQGGDGNPFGLFVRHSCHSGIWRYPWTMESTGFWSAAWGFVAPTE